MKVEFHLIFLTENTLSLYTRSADIKKCMLCMLYFTILGQRKVYASALLLAHI